MVGPKNCPKIILAQYCSGPKIGLAQIAWAKNWLDLKLLRAHNWSGPKLVGAKFCKTLDWLGQKLVRPKICLQNNVERNCANKSVKQKTC